MIARHDTHLDKTDLWSALAAPVPPGTISWRQDGRSIQRDGKWYARFVAYIDANTVRERLDAVVPGEWDLTLDLLPPIPGQDDDGTVCSFKARLQILGVIREDVGTGRDYKAAATDAFKRAAVRFGVGHELYAMEQNWVQVAGEGRYTKPLEDPQAAYDRRHGPGATAGRAASNGIEDAATNGTTNGEPAGRKRRGSAERIATVARAAEPDMVPATVELAEELAAHAAAHPARQVSSNTLLDAETVRCPKCDGQMWDNRATKRNPKAPDFKCRDRNCDGVIWPPREKAARGGTNATSSEPEAEPMLDTAPLGAGSEEDLPF